MPRSRPCRRGRSGTQDRGFVGAGPRQQRVDRRQHLARLAADVLRGVAGHLAGEVDRAVVDGHLLHARRRRETLHHASCLLPSVAVAVLRRCVASCECWCRACRRRLRGAAARLAGRACSRCRRAACGCWRCGATPAAGSSPRWPAPAAPTAPDQQLVERREHRRHDRRQRRIAKERRDDDPGGQRRQRPASGLSASSTPAAVATPLPPLKRKNTGHRWPRNAASPTSATVPSPRPKRGAEQQRQQHRHVALQRIEQPASARPRPCCPSAARWSRRGCPSRRCAGRPGPSRG